MTYRSMATAAVLALALGSATDVSAATLDLNFEFSGTDIMGTFFGVTDDATSAATSFTLQGSGFTNFSMASAAGLNTNLFTLSGGIVTVANFLFDSGPINAFQRFEVFPDQNRGGFLGRIGVFDASDPGSHSDLTDLFSTQNTLTFTSSPAQVSPVPLPAGGLLLLSGLGGVAALKRRKKRAVLL